MRRCGIRKCSCGKNAFTSFRRAQRTVNRTDAERPYWCPEAGAYHITGIPRGEWDAAQALRVVIDLSVQSRDYVVM